MQISNLKYLSLMSTEAIFDDLDLSKNKALEKVGLFGELSGTLQIDYNPNLPYVTLPVEHDFRVIKNDHELQGHIFADADLITCIEDHLNVLGDGALLSEITTLNCDGYDIVSLKGIEALWNLQRLSLLNTRVSRVELLNFNRLKEFLISSPILTKLDMSQYELEVFHIENSPITAIFLTSTNLRERSVTNVPLRRLSIVHAESSLESLTLLNTEISSFDTNRYPRLKYVDIQ